MEKHLANKPRVKLGNSRTLECNYIFLVHPQEATRAEVCNHVFGTGAGQTSGKQCGGLSVLNLGKIFRFLKNSRCFFFPDIRDLQNFPLPAMFWPIFLAFHAMAAGSRIVPLGKVGCGPKQHFLLYEVL